MTHREQGLEAVSALWLSDTAGAWHTGGGRLPVEEARNLCGELARGEERMKEVLAPTSVRPLSYGHRRRKNT